MIDRIVLNIPHASKAFPSGGRARWEGGIDTYIDRWTDTATDWLFATASLTDPRIHPVVFPWSRFYCDAERLKGDPLEGKGQGIVYSRFEECQRELTGGERDGIVSRWYDSHVESLRRELTPSSLLVDCHSFPPDLSDTEICLGVNEDWSRPAKTLLTRVFDLFVRKGYRVSVNKPYASSFAPRMQFPYPSIMIEVNKGTYLDTGGELNHAKAVRLKAAIGAFYSMILDDESELLAFYKKNFPLLYRNRERIWADPRMACSEVVGFRILGKMHVSLGAVLKAIEDGGDLFRYGPDGVVCYFVGNPMTGSTGNRVVDLRTGRVSTRKDGSFHARAVAIRSALKSFPVSRRGSLPLTVIIEKLLSDGE